MVMENNRRGKGRQKVEIAKMANESNLHVTFSKRRSGLFKKASELSTLCGVEIGVVVFSPGNKAFSFGHPSVDMVIDRYFGQNPSQHSPTTELINGYRHANIHDLNMQLTQVTDENEMGMKRVKELNQIQNENMSQLWWHKPVDQLDLSQVQQLKEAMLKLKINVEQQKDIASIRSSDAMQQLFGASSSSNQPFDPNNNNEVFNPDMVLAPDFPNNGVGQFNL